ncbi:MAG: PQQ-binding-like beta-propeller repeat protein [Planctomycetia bacterium]|nr:PQQ-binding-like beta-propeller repeat protein [Planctomycetia bacterium]
MTNDDQKNKTTNQTILNVSSVSNIRNLYRLSLLGITISSLTFLGFLSFLLANYYAPYQLNDLSRKLETKNQSQNEYQSNNDLTNISDDFIMDGLSQEQKDVELPVSKERFTFLILPNEFKEYVELKKQLINDPDNSELQAKLRTLDVVLREDFFQRRHNASQYSFLLLFSGVLLIFFAKTTAVLNRRLTAANVQIESQGQRRHIKNLEQKAIFVGIAFLGALAIGMTFGLWLSGRSELETFLSKKLDEVESSVLTPAKDNHLNIKNEQQANEPLSSPPQDIVINEEPNVDPRERDSFLKIWNQNWPTFRGPFQCGVLRKPSHRLSETDLQSINSTENQYPLTWNIETNENILWKSPIPLDGHNSPIVWGERIFLSGANETERKVFCFHTKTGALIWMTEIPVSPEGTGPLNLNHETGFAPSTMVTDGQRVYAIFPNGDLVALDFDGKIIWQKGFGIPENNYGFTASLALWFDRVIIQFDVDSFKINGESSETKETMSEKKSESKLVAVKGEDGTILWETSRPDAKGSWGSPIVQCIGETDQIVLMGDPYLAAYNPENGQELWRYSGFRSDVTPTPIVVDSTVYAVNESQFFAALNATGTGELAETDHFLWKAQSSGLPNTASPLPFLDRIFLLAENGTLTGLDVEKQESFCELFVDEGDSFYASPVLIDHYIYLFSKSSDEPNAYIIDANKLTPENVNLDMLDLTEAENALIAKIPLAQPIFASPTLKDGVLVIRDQNNLWGIGQSQK